LRLIRGARAAAREQVWKVAGASAPGTGGALIPLDLDATIVIAHAEKEQATPTWKKTFGFPPLCSFIDHGRGGTGEPGVLVLRKGNAGHWSTPARCEHSPTLSTPTSGSSDKTDSAASYTSTPGSHEVTEIRHPQVQG
jgi:hypothetical protein